MDETMHIDGLNSSRTRKRSSAWITNDGLDPEEGTSAAPEDTPSKRLLGSRGEAIQTGRIIKYNVQKLLNHLAFTRVYVTANFHNYNPSKSFVILCMVSEQDDLYHTVCQLLPSLYTNSPNLQALAITKGYVDPNRVSDQALLRQLPLATTAGMMDDVVDECQSFREEIRASQSCVAVIDPSGVCIWNSIDDVHSMTLNSIEAVRRGIVHAVGGSEFADVEMHDG